MQAQITGATVLQEVRPGIRNGNKKQKPLCKRGAARKKAAPSILGQFNSVIFQSKPAVDIILKDQTLHQQLFDALSNYYQIVNSKPYQYSIHTLPLGSSCLFDRIKEEFSLLVDQDCQWQIDRTEKGDYFFVIYKACDWDEQWHIFEVKTIIKNIDSNEDLLITFMSFLKMFSKKTGVDLWYQGDAMYAQDFLEEQILNLTDESEGSEDAEWFTDNIKRIEDCLEVYKSGDAAAFENSINQSCDWEPDELIEEIKSLESDHLIIDLMIEGCQLCIDPDRKSIVNYYYNPDEGTEYNGEGLHFEQQFTILWDDSDGVAIELGELIDSGAQESVDVPYAWLMVNKETTTVFKRDTWLPKIDKFFEHACDLVRKIYNNE